MNGTIDRQQLTYIYICIYIYVYIWHIYICQFACLYTDKYMSDGSQCRLHQVFDAIYWLLPFPPPTTHKSTHLTTSTHNTFHTHKVKVIRGTCGLVLYCTVISITWLSFIATDVNAFHRLLWASWVFPFECASCALVEVKLRGHALLPVLGCRLLRLRHCWFRLVPQQW